MEHHHHQHVEEKHEHEMYGGDIPDEAEMDADVEMSRVDDDLDDPNSNKQFEDCSFLASINELPDDVLVLILSRLTLREAARTCVLSKRWTYLWTSYADLNFDATERLISKYKKPNLYVILLNINKRPNRWLCKVRKWYIGWVNSVVRQHTGAAIDKLRISFNLDINCSESVDHWITSALSKRLQWLELDCNGRSGYVRPLEEKYAFLGNHFCQGKEIILPDSNSISSSLCSSALVGLKSLKCLLLKELSVSDGVLKYLLSTCPVLERLELVYVDGLVNVRVSGLLNLKHLKIIGCDAKTIQIRDTNLISFKYLGPEIRLNLMNVPLLVDVNISEGFFRLEDYVKQLSCCLFQLESLTINLSRIREDDLYVLPELSKLRQLVLEAIYWHDRSLLQIKSLFKACPYLEKFSLKLHSPWTIGIVESELEDVNYHHRYLKVVEFCGYSGSVFDIELAMYFIENAIYMEKLIIITHKKEEHEKEEEEEEDDTKCRAKQQLEGKVPPRIELVIL